LRIAIVGSGVSGLVAAHLLHDRHDVTLFESGERPGGHTNTVRVDLADATVEVDTGFLVYTERNYPNFVRLLQRLGVATQPSDMSFSMSDEHSGIEWRGTSPSTVFARRRNIVRPAFLRMLADVGRFNRTALRLLEDPPAEHVTLADVLATRRWSRGFLDWYLVPLGASIWSADPGTFMSIPAARFARFFERHGLLRFADQPGWRTVSGGARHYVDAIVAPLAALGRLRLGTPVGKIRRTPGGVELWSPRTGSETFDHVVVATHSDQALGLLSDPTRLERDVLGAVRYQPNRATLHTDTGLMPSNRRAWASWNYHRADPEPERATLTYYLNTLQGLETREGVFVTLNRDEVIDPEKVIASFDYAHPVLDTAAAIAQSRRLELNSGRVSFCGAYFGDGFHEDGVRSALEACEPFGVGL